MDFNDCTLYVSPRSPFARRVRLALLEGGIRFSEKILDVFKPNPELNEINPLARVPVVRFKTGEVLVDSSLILDALYRAHPASFPRLSESDSFLVWKWMAQGLGLCEKTIEYFFENLRPKESRDTELLAEIDGVIPRVLSAFEKEMQGKTSLIPGMITQGDLDMGTALAYICLRYSGEWKSRFPAAARFLDELERRKSFELTRPPKPT